jgi:prephenate dehydrogenase
MQINKENTPVNDVTISIVGGTGGMGKLFAKVFKKHAKEVIICSRNIVKAKKVAKSLNVSTWPLEECGKADVVLVSIPIEETYKVCKKISDKMKKGTLLIELSSVKLGIADKLSKDLKKKGINYLSLHPLFGPRIRSLKGKKIVIIRSNKNIIEEKILKFFVHRKATMIESNVEEHDRFMAAIQVAHHFMYLGYLTMEKHYDMSSMKEFATESFKRTLKTLKMIKENRDTILTIQKLNPYAKETRSRFIESLSKIREMDPDSVELIHESLDRWN